ncbi:unnamed protein product, partial [Vitis vinifera]
MDGFTTYISCCFPYHLKIYIPCSIELLSGTHSRCPLEEENLAKGSQLELGVQQAVSNGCARKCLELFSASLVTSLRWSKRFYRGISLLQLLPIQSAAVSLSLLMLGLLNPLQYLGLGKGPESHVA